MSSRERDADQGCSAGAIDRLRASRFKADEQDTTRGRRDGKAWAEEVAEYRWLRRLADGCSVCAQPFETLRMAIDPNGEIDPNEVHETCFGDENDVANEYILGFIAGAVETFQNIRDRL
ncbi:MULTISPECIES: hypothetical protein [Bradyrhizobium]|uniref:Uncharacterized protein n=1 Tax=Bradyrhizobium elkanii TaxID=29448 RepID=A0A4U6S6Z6_BRAEL|nr:MULTISPECIES: hypothetical protein [Bradyrhizobium]MTV16765.1 hypothetical protein [Bradyrhizobium sp. BR2003]TKV80456.1 hypothetical protein FDV58_17030 [Bradyrhizobium elkanii]